MYKRINRFIWIVPRAQWNDDRLAWRNNLQNLFRWKFGVEIMSIYKQWAQSTIELGAWIEFTRTWCGFSYFACKSVQTLIICGYSNVFSNCSLVFFRAVEAPCQSSSLLQVVYRNITLSVLKSIRVRLNCVINVFSVRFTK